MSKSHSFAASLLIAVAFSTVMNSATAQVALKSEDLVGTWERVSTKDLKTGAVDRPENAVDIEWMQFGHSHYVVVAMDRGRKVISDDEFAKLSPEEKIKTNYARVWNEKNDQIFVGRGGTYSVEGDRIHQNPMLALYTNIIGADDVLQVTRLDKNTLVVHRGMPIVNPTITLEVTYRRLE